MALEVLCGASMALPKRIPIPDAPPPVSRQRQGVVIAGIAVFCASVVVAAIVFVFFGA